MKIAVLGAGMVGRTIALDLAKQHTVSSFDFSIVNLDILRGKNKNINCINADLQNTELFPELFSSFDLMVSAVPGFMGFKTLECLVPLGKNIVDISFFPENALVLNDSAKKNNTTVIVDCGVAPGMSNLILGYQDTQMKIDRFECMVGGLPKVRTLPFEYKAPFSPIDVIEEYTRPARYVENNTIITRPALSDPELIDVEKAGTLESFNTDGLRSILYTMKHIPNMKEKTLRYPGHIALIDSLKRSGFFSNEEINVSGNMLRPIDITSALLFNQWKLLPGEPEFTVMTISIEGINEGGRSRVDYTLYDENDPVEGHSSMSRTTGFTCAAAVNLLAEKLFTDHGVYPPELVGKKSHCYEYIMNYLAARNVNFKVTSSQS